MAPKTKKISKTRRKKLDSVITDAVKKLCFTLDIQTTNTSPQHGMLMNRFEEPDSRIKSINVGEVTYYDPESEEHVPYTTAKLKTMPGYTADTMTFESVWRDMDTNQITATTTKTFTKEGGFSCWDVIKNIVKFEKLDRPKTKWFGGIDCHHVFYEGIHFNKDNKTLGISWGS
jgi:hypothetical protein